MYSSYVMNRERKQDVSTPISILNELEQFGSTEWVDPCPLNCMEFDGLKEPWNFPFIFVNPPYRRVFDWIKKGLSEISNEHSLVQKVVYLIPFNPTSRWFHSLCYNRSKDVNCCIFLISKKVIFEGYKRPAPFPVCFVILTKGDGQFHLDVEANQ